MAAEKTFTLEVRVVICHSVLQSAKAQYKGKSGWEFAKVIRRVINEHEAKSSGSGVLIGTMYVAADGERRRALFQPNQLGDISRAVADEIMRTACLAFPVDAATKAAAKADVDTYTAAATLGAILPLGTAAAKH